MRSLRPCRRDAKRLGGAKRNRARSRHGRETHINSNWTAPKSDSGNTLNAPQLRGCRRETTFQRRHTCFNDTVRRQPTACCRGDKSSQQRSRTSNPSHQIRDHWIWKTLRIGSSESAPCWTAPVSADRPSTERYRTEVSRDKSLSAHVVLAGGSRPWAAGWPIRFSIERRMTDKLICRLARCRKRCVRSAVEQPLKFSNGAGLPACVPIMFQAIDSHCGTS